ncbi:hypothetical protein HOI71_15415, partial [Candidatus Poribacteria bacterium]|nr:hypothetical protein [Candidatus Poribacteria bacterium]
MERAARVVRLAADLFHSTSAAHGLPTEDLEVVRTAACLHDLGAGATGPTQAAQLVLQHGIAGLEAADVAVVAGAVGSLGGLVAAPDDDGRAARICALVAIAAALDDDGAIDTQVAHVDDTRRALRVYVGPPAFAGSVKSANAASAASDQTLRRPMRLAADGGSVSLHAWGSVAAALALPFAKWRPTRAERDGKFKWLLDRACVMEGSTGQAATIAWQNHCQKRWLAAARPSAVVWPWENQSWERQFVRDAKVANVATIGYQHTVVGPQLLNHSPRSNADGTASLPERIFCNGPSTMAQLKAYGIEESRMKIAG